MKKKRYLPFGYQMNEGNIIPDILESSAVQSIFENYRNGASLQMLAKQMPCWAKPTSRTVSARRCASTAVNGRSIMWRTTIRQSSMPTPSHRCRRNWQGEPQNARSSRSARLQSRANIAENTRSLNCLSVGNARLHTADALGLQTVKRELCGAVSAALTTAKNTVTTHRLWKKPHYRKQS